MPSDTVGDTGSTGLEKLDNRIRTGGIEFGSLIGVQSDPLSPGKSVISKMVAGKSCYYYTTHETESECEKRLSSVPNLDVNEVHIESVNVDDIDSQLDSLRNSINNTDFPGGGRIVIDTVNFVEDEDGEYLSFLNDLKRKIREEKCIGIIHKVNMGNNMENEWMSLYKSDTVFNVVHRKEDENITDYLVLEKFNRNQELQSKNTGEFRLTDELDIDIESSRNVTP